jgi:hypothetical protein
MGVHLGEIPHQVFGLLIGASVGVGFWRGGREGAVLGLTVLAQLALAWGLFGLGISRPVWSSPAVDLATLAICVVIVLRSRNYWTVWAAASPLLALATLVLQAAVDFTPWAYLSAQRAWTLLFVAAVIAGPLLSPRLDRPSAAD